MKQASKPFCTETAWAKLKCWAQTLVGVIGAPVALARQGVLRREARAEILVLLAPLEALVRRLLLLEALRMPAPEPVIARKPRRRRKRKAAPPAPSKPGFRLWTALRAKRVRLRRYKLTDDLTFRALAPNRPETYPALPIAHRLEAVMAVLENPAPHVTRLARLIVRAPQPRRLSTQHRRDAPRPLAIMQAEVQPHIEAALARLPSRGALAGWDSS